MEKLQDSLHFIDQGEPAQTRRNKHIVFMDSEKDAKKFDVARHLDTAPELIHRTFNRPRLETLKQTDLDAVVSKEQIKVREKRMRTSSVLTD
jgi:U3 small nucleolar RNA-associated protein 11